MWKKFKSHQRKHAYCIAFCIGIVVLMGVFLLKQKTSLFPTSLFGKSSACKDCNVLLISLDTCGADHMSTYGYARDTTPNLTALAKKGILFQNAHVNANWTLPSHVSIFTGLFPLHHKIREIQSDVLDSSIPLLPDVLQQNGYETYFYSPNTPETLPQDVVYSRGITHWIESEVKYHVSDVKSFQVALDELEKNGQDNKKTFMFYHTYACHGPYMTEDEPLLYADAKDAFLPLQSEDVNESFSAPFLVYLLTHLKNDLQEGNVKIAPAQIQNLYTKLQQASSFEEAQRIYREGDNNAMYGEGVLFGKYVWDFNYENKIDVNNPKHMAFLAALYDQGVHSMDEHILGLLKTTIDQGKLPKNTIVIITADHGEEFMEHGQRLHMTIYDNNTRVPLIILAPGIVSEKISEHVQSTDIFPTILDLVGVKNIYTFDGVSLFPLLHKKMLGSRLIVAETNWNTTPFSLSVRDGDWKLFLFKNGDGLFEPYALYNTKNDPGEKNTVMIQNMRKMKDIVKKFNALQYPQYRAID